MKNLLRALSYFKQDWRTIGVLMAFLISSIALNVLKPWPLALMVDSVLGQKPYPSWIPEGMAALSRPAQLGGLIGALLLLSLGHATISAVQLYLSISVGLRGLRRVRNEVFAWLQRLSLRFHHGTLAGDIIFRAGSDTCAFQALFQQGVLVLLTAVCTLVMMLIVMVRLNVSLTLLALVAVPILLASIKGFGHAMRTRGLVAQESESQVYSLIHQGITALPLIQSNTREQDEHYRFAVQTERARQHKMSQHGLEVFYWFVISVILSVSTAGVTWYGAQQVMSSTLTLGELLVFLAYLAQMFEPLNQISQVGATISTAGASTRRVFEVLDAPDEVKDCVNARPVLRANRQTAKNGNRASSPAAANGHVPAADGARHSLEAYGNLVFDDVSFEYQKSKPVLRKISFQLQAGDSAAIIGPSGAGKTTMLNLLPRFFDPAGGAVLLEGVDLRQLRVKDLRAQIAMVLQEPIILPTTIAENISYGRPTAKLEEIEAAAQAANADEFIRKLPLQYKTVVGEGGVRLSVGEKQRINLARAFLKDAPILLMDEPTSALDVESESQVVASLFQLMRGRTTLMVAHRLTTIQRISKILVVEGGSLTEVGTPEQLLERRGYYARVVSGQLQLR
jgi:ATP-binding cassette, subfamily B, bacterial